MPIDDNQRRILLAQSGELTAGQRVELDAQLAQDPAGRAYRDDLERLTAVAQEALVPAGAGGPALSHVQALAREQVARRQILWFNPIVRQGLAAAALLVLLLGGWQLMPTVDRRAERIAEISAILHATVESASMVEPAGETTHDPQLRALAHQLLALEGLALDDAGGADDWELITEDAAPVPTALRPHSSPGLPGKRYG